MIYINENTTEIKIPKHVECSSNELECILVNNLTGNNYPIDIEGKSSLNAYFYILDASVQNIPIGEYTFYLNHDNNTLESGLLIYGDYKPTSSKTYNQDKTNKIIYERD